MAAPATRVTIKDPVIPVPPPVESDVRKAVVVFGASWAKPGDELWKEGADTGAEIAKNGFKLINGGYSGTMTSSCIGHEAADPSGERVGVIVPGLFHSRPLGNDHLTTAVHSNSLLQRIEWMIMHSDYFIVLKGTLGTLAELAAVWNLAMLHGEGRYRAPKIYCVRKPWEAVVSSIVGELGVTADFAAHIRFVDDGVEAAKAIAADFAATAATTAAGATSGAGAMPSS